MIGATTERSLGPRGCRSPGRWAKPRMALACPLAATRDWGSHTSVLCPWRQLRWCACRTPRQL
eukprot:1313431-Alexandrium_andersonii.AAC.1